MIYTLIRATPGLVKTCPSPIVMPRFSYLIARSKSAIGVLITGANVYFPDVLRWV